MVIIVPGFCNGKQAFEADCGLAVLCHPLAKSALRYYARNSQATNVRRQTRQSVTPPKTNQLKPKPKPKPNTKVLPQPITVTSKFFL